MGQIALISPKGGVGKSTLAECLRQSLSDVEVVDLDHQKTLTFLAEINGKPRPVAVDAAKAKYIIYDTPPYNDVMSLDLMRKVDKIVIPIRSGPPDLAAFPVVYENLRKTKSFKKAIVVFNGVRRPITNSHKNIVSIFMQNFPKINVAKTIIPNLVGFQKALFSDLEGDALLQIQKLIKELII